MSKRWKRPISLPLFLPLTLRPPFVFNLIHYHDCWKEEGMLRSPPPGNQAPLAIQNCPDLPLYGMEICRCFSKWGRALNGCSHALLPFKCQPTGGRNDWCPLRFLVDTNQKGVHHVVETPMGVSKKMMQNRKEAHLPRLARLPLLQHLVPQLFHELRPRKRCSGRGPQGVGSLLPTFAHRECPPSGESVAPPLTSPPPPSFCLLGVAGLLNGYLTCPKTRPNARATGPNPTVSPLGTWSTSGTWLETPGE